MLFTKPDSTRDLMHQIIYYCPKSFKHENTTGETNDEELDALEKTIENDSKKEEDLTINNIKNYAHDLINMENEEAEEAGAEKPRNEEEDNNKNDSSSSSVLNSTKNKKRCGAFLI